VRRALFVAVTNIALAGTLLGLAPAAALIDLRDPSDLRGAFNKDRGKIRLVLLVSPT
jgi:hypothetical protein